jgi:hypothetical protein
MNFVKMLELQDYIKEKLADLETAKDGSLEQFIKNVEKLMEKGFTFIQDPKATTKPIQSPEELSPERQKLKAIKETIEKSRRAKSTMRTGYDNDSIVLPSLVMSDYEDLAVIKEPKTTKNRNADIFKLTTHSLELEE